MGPHPLSPKMQTMLKLVRDNQAEARQHGKTSEEWRDAKVVIFSQHKEAILHASVVLKNAGIGHARIVRGDRAAEQQQAVRRFNEDRGCICFLLHAGQAAAGQVASYPQSRLAVH